MAESRDGILRQCRRIPTQFGANNEERGIEGEKGTFTPLIFATSGGMGPLCHNFFKKTATHISEETNEGYENVIHHVRVRTRFPLLMSTVML